MRLIGYEPFLAEVAELKMAKTQSEFTSPTKNKGLVLKEEDIKMSRGKMTLKIWSPSSK
jgi:hypothetical protein